MFTQRNNKAKCVQDCIVENKKRKRIMNGLRFKVRLWVGDEGVGGRGGRLVLSWVGWRWVGAVDRWVGDLVKTLKSNQIKKKKKNLKPFTLSCTPCRQTECKMSAGRKGETDRHPSSRIWFGAERWIQKAYGSRGFKRALIQNDKSHLHCLPCDNLCCDDA